MDDKLDLAQQEQLIKINRQYNLNLSDDFICNKCTLIEYLSLVESCEQSHRIQEERYRKEEKCNEQSDRIEYRIRPIDAKGNAKN